MFCEHFRVCFDLPLQNLFRTTLWLLRRYRADSRNEWSCTASRCCNTHHCSGWCLNCFSFHDPVESHLSILGVLNSRNLPPFVKHEDPIGHDDWLIFLVPVSIIKFWCILFDLPWRRSTRIFISLFVQNNVVEHWHEDDLITEVFNCDVLSLRPTQFLLGKSSTRSQSALHFILAILWRYDTSSKLTFYQTTFFYCIFWTVSESEQT